MITLTAQEVPAVTETRKRKAVSTSNKAICSTSAWRGTCKDAKGWPPGTPEHGEAFESFIHQEITAYCSYRRLNPPGYWRSKSGFEVDFVFQQIAPEVKAKTNVSARDWRGLAALKEEGLTRRHLLVCMEPDAAS